LPDFSWYSIPKREEIYQMAKNISSGRKIDHCQYYMYTNISHCKALQNFTQIAIFGQKIGIPSGNPDFRAISKEKQNLMTFSRLQSCRLKFSKNTSK
jgi:hypothetical protein